MVGDGRTYERQDALDLISRIESGSLADWHHFIERYSPLLFGVVRRYLAGWQEDDQRALYVEMLAALYRGRLRDYVPRSSLSTWLFVFARSRCLDLLRRRRGRRALPSWLATLPPLDREVYRLAYLRGLSAREVCQHLARRVRRVTLDEVAASILRIETRVDDGVRRKLAFALQARSMGLLSGRLLQYLHAVRIRNEQVVDEANPESAMMLHEADSAAKRLRDVVARLPEAERDVIVKRYFERLTARRTAEALNMVDQRRVYAVEARAIRRLRGLIAG